jgi:hypothetical protein
MNAVLFYNWVGEINGSLINAFEYFLKIYEHNKDVRFCLLNGNFELIEYLWGVFQNRYYLNDLNEIRHQIVPFQDYYTLIRSEFDRVLVLDFGTIYKTKGLIKAKKIYVIQEKHTYEKAYQYESPNVLYFGEMPFQRKDKEYRMKFLFDRFRQPDQVEETIYVNSPKNQDRSFLDHITYPDKPLIFKTTTHLTNLFSKFDTYLYYHADKWFDPTPRLFVECAFYRKNILYFNNKKVIDGSYYRYHDLIENGLKNRLLTKEDEIVRRMI